MKFKKGNIPHNYVHWQFNNLNKNLAYIIGAFLTDGSVCRRNRNNYISYEFKLSSIDKEYPEYIRKCLEVELKKQIKLHIDYRGKPRKKQYYINISNNDFGKWLLDISKDKTIIPEIIKNADKDLQREFLIGCLDGDGIMAVNGKNYKMGICGIHGWFDEMYIFMQKFGLILGEKNIDKRVWRNEELIIININKKSALLNNLGFRIQRKQKRLLNFATLNHINILRDYMLPTLYVKR